jgi:hypothetical protein
MYNPNTNLENGFFAMRKIIVVASLILIAFLNGCASVPMSSIENDTARKNFPSPSPGTAGLYIYRNTSLGGGLKKDIFIDDERVAETAPMTYFYFEVQEGIRKLSTESEFSPNDLIVDVEKGNNYFVRQSIRLGLFVGGADLELVSEEEGRKGVLECKLANNIDGNVLVNTGGVKTPVLATQTSPESETSVFDYYSQAEEEINTQTYNQNLWDKALVETGGDQNKTKARYIELRANQLYYEKYGSLLTLDSEGTQINLSGTYISDITSNSHWQFTKRYQKLRITFEQSGNKITGIDDRYNTKINGTIADNTIRFYVEPGQALGGYDAEGEWNISSDGKKLEGSWKSRNSADSAAGTWTLSKVE